MNHPTAVVFYTNLAIVVLIGLIIWLTSNPLAIMGLLLLQQAPILQSPEQMLQAMAEAQDGDEDPEYNESQGGFLGKLRDKAA